MQTQESGHALFGRLLQERAAPGIEVVVDVPFGSEAQDCDFLLVRRQGGEHAASHVEPRVLRGLWSHLGTETLMDFKTVARPFATRDLERLLGLGLHWWVEGEQRLLRHEDLTLVLVVPARTPLLEQAAERLGYQWRQLSDGYHALDGAPLPLLVVELDTVARAEHDSIIGTFGHGDWSSADARQWWLEQGGSVPREQNGVEALEGYDEISRRLLEGLTPEQRVKGLSPAQRLAGLAPEEQILVLPDEMLRNLPEEYIESLPPNVRARIRERTKR